MYTKYENGMYNMKTHRDNETCPNSTKINWTFNVIFNRFYSQLFMKLQGVP